MHLDLLSIPQSGGKNVKINADQWTAAHDEGEWRRTAEQAAEHFMAKWTAAEKAKAGLRHAVVCLNVTGNTKIRIVQIIPPVLSTYPLHTNSGCGKERRILIGPW